MADHNVVAVFRERMEAEMRRPVELQWEHVSGDAGPDGVAAKRVCAGLGEYEGSWRGGLRDGAGAMVFEGTGARYEGGWKDDKQEGEGTYFYANGNTFAGTWRADKKEGRGTVTAPNGYAFTGEYKNDKME